MSKLIRQVRDHCHCEEARDKIAKQFRAEATKQSIFALTARWIASRSLSSGALRADRLARNDGDGARHLHDFGILEIYP